MGSTAETERDSLAADYERAKTELHQMLAGASSAQLKSKSAGTRWTNEQLLYHMVFGYMVVRALLPLVRFFGRLPPSLSKGFAAFLNAGTRPFDVVNYWGSTWGAIVFNRSRMEAQLDRTLRALLRHRDRETAKSLNSGMAFPTRWDPFFASRMSLAEVYSYPTKHFDFHRRQLGLLGEGRPTEQH